MLTQSSAFAPRRARSFRIAAAVSSIERRVTSITGQLRSVKKRRACGHLLAHLGEIGVVAALLLVQRGEALRAHLDQPVGIVGQADDQRPRQLEQFLRQRHARHDRHVRRLDAAIGEIDAGRRLRGARDADQDDIGIVQAPERLAVIVIEGEGHRVDALEILAVEQMLLAGQTARLAAEIGGERADHRIEHRDRRHLQLAAAFDQRLAQRVVDERIEHDAGIGADAGDDAIDLRSWCGPSTRYARSPRHPRTARGRRAPRNEPCRRSNPRRDEDESGS